MIRLAIVDDHAIFRIGLLAILKSIESFEIIIEAENGKEFIRKLKENPVDCVLLDLQMPLMNGEEVVDFLKKDFLDIKIIILTFKKDVDNIKRLLNKGVDGYFSKNGNPFDLVNGIKKVKNGGFFIEDSIEKLIGKENNQDYSQLENSIILSSREKEIIELYAKEYTGKEISEILHISPRTVEVHKKNLMERFGAKNFIGVILFALQNNLIHL